MALLLLLGLPTPPATAASTADFVRGDPAKYVGPEECGQCHASEFDVWERSPHNRGADTLDKERGEEAYAIAERLGFDLIRRDSVCLTCHFTVRFKRGRLRAIEGVSCESCHGPSKDWLNVHNDYGSVNGQAAEYCKEGSRSATGSTGKPCETAKHRAERRRMSIDAGMLRPNEDLYALASACLECHLVPDEALVNEGQHKAGSGTFELVDWSQRREIRHNFLDSYRAGDGTAQKATSDERKRLMFVVGRMAELAGAYTGVATASSEGRYLAALTRRAEAATYSLLDLSDAVGNAVPEIETLLEIASKISVTAGNRVELEQAAARIEELAGSFQASFDASRYPALDALIRGDGPGAEEQAPDAGDEGPADPTTATAGTADGEGSTVSSRSAGRPRRTTGAAGNIKSRIRPASSRGTVGASNCSDTPACHIDEQKWWRDDSHYGSKKRFSQKSSDVQKIARIYGVKLSEITTGKSLCMDCHGTVESPGSRRPVRDGVGCESCHGPARDYLDAHERIEKEPEAQGANRPGYREAISLGMVDLLDANTRVQRCASCHYITDARLISTGHPTGKKSFDVAERMGKIEHWDGIPAINSGALTAAWQQVLARRGPVPDVAVVTAPASQANGSETAGTQAPTSTGRPGVGLTDVPSGAASTTRTEDTIVLPPFPAIEAQDPVDEVLLLLDDRLERVRQALRDPGDSQ